MKKLYKKIGLICLIFLLPAVCFAQKRLAKANRLYDNLSFAAAVPEYERALKSDPDNSEALLKLAHCYRLINNTLKAEKWYSKVVELKEAKPAHMMFYTQALMSNGNYTEAEKWIQRYSKVAGKNDRTERILQSLQHLNSLVEDSMNYSVQKLSINSPQSDVCPVYYEDGIVFVSSRKRIEMVQRTHEWTGLPFLSLYFSKGSENTFSNPELFAPALHTKFNNGSICFNKTFDELYVTRNNIDEGKIGRSDSGIIKLKIYSFKRSGSKWKNETSFQFNSDQYNCAHPCLNNEGSKLFFASDMPGGFGGMDIYICSKTEKGWGQPVNLGPDVNTSANEGFPFIDGKDGIYYSSDGRGGLGGFDIFYSPLIRNGYAAVVNLGFPVNSSGDDFGWTQNSDGTEGYFSSNREDKNENDEIYSFKRAAILLNVLVYDEKSKLPLSASTVKIMESGRQKKVLMSSDSGYINFLMTPGKNYQFITEKEKYIPDSTGIETKSMAIASTQNLSVSLKKLIIRMNFKGQLLDNDRNKTGMGGVIVKLIDKATGEERIAITNADGTYEFPDVPIDANYTLESRKGKFASEPVDISSTDMANYKVGAQDKEFADKLNSLSSLTRDITRTTLKGRILNNNNDKTGMAGVLVRLLNKKSKVARTTITDEDGNYKFEGVLIDAQYFLDAMKDNYVMLPIDLGPEDLMSNKALSTNIEMSNTSDVIKIDKFYYDLDKFEIRPDAKLVLDKLVDLMKTHPEMKIELRSHTDCRYTKAYNKKLSNKRAQAAVEYLVDNGIKTSRLKAKGYGESLPVNVCECEDEKLSTSCTDAQYQENRRTEFKIISMR